MHSVRDHGHHLPSLNELTWQQAFGKTIASVCQRWCVFDDQLARLYKFMYHADRTLVCPLEELQFLGVAFVNNGNGLRVVDLGNELNRTSRAPEQSIEQDQHRNPLVLRSVA